MKLKSQRLALVHELAERESEKATKSLAQARQYLDQQQQQLNSLNEYLQAYAADLRASSIGTVSITRLQTAQQFMSQINQAISQQELVIQHAKVQFEQAKKVWLSCRDKAKNLQDLVKKTREEEIQTALKKEEKQIQDDLQSRRRQ